MSLSPFSARVSLIKLKIPFGMLWSDPIARYSPSKIVRAVPTVITGNPDPNETYTSHVERQNLTMWTFLRRLTRLSLGFSKKLENLKHAIALHFAFYNFCRVHKSLRVTPAMEAGLTDHVWTLGELLT